MKTKFRMTAVAALAAAVSVLPAMSQDEAASCDVSPDYMKARYVFSVSANGGEANEDAASRTSTMVLWRRPGQVAYEHKADKVTEIWTLTPKKRIKIDRYTDASEHGIEIYPSGEPLPDEPAMFEQRRRIVTTAMLDALEQTGTEGEGCERVEVYEGDLDGQATRVEWMPELELAQALTIERDTFTEDWSLKSWSAKQNLVDRAYARREAWPTVDHADIGDMENDPFVAELNRLGLTSSLGGDRGHSHGDGHGH